MYSYLVYYQFIWPYLAADIWPQHHSATISCFLYYSYPLTGPHPAWHSVSVGRVCVTLLTICALSTFALWVMHRGHIKGEKNRKMAHGWEESCGTKIKPSHHTTDTVHTDSGFTCPLFFCLSLMKYYSYLISRVDSLSCGSGRSVFSWVLIVQNKLNLSS